MSASKHQLHADLDFMLAKDLEHRNMFKKLEEICVGFGIIADRFCKEKHYFDRESLIMAGSLEEGITISRSFKPREEEEKNIPLILDGEVDQMRIYLRMKKEDVTPLLEISQRNVGYLKMRWDNILHERLKKHFDVESVSYFSTTDSNKVRYMDPTKLRSLAAGYAYDEDLINRLLSLVLREVVKLKYWKSTTRASSCFEISGFIKNIYLSISIDHVPAMHLDFWPDIADEWRNRSRLWPPEQKIDEIVNKGCLIVARSSHGGDERSEQTFSFRGAEIELAHLRTTNQLKVYGMCKIIHYHHIKPFVWVGEKGKKHDFSSYPIKTTMLWFCEQHPPDDPVWDDANLLETIDMLLKILQGYMENRHLPSYFLPSLNILQTVPDNIMEKVASKIQHIRDNIVYVIDNLHIRRVCSIMDDPIINDMAYLIDAFGNLITAVYENKELSLALVSGNNILTGNDDSFKTVSRISKTIVVFMSAFFKLLFVNRARTPLLKILWFLFYNCIIKPHRIVLLACVAVFVLVCVSIFCLIL